MSNTSFTIIFDVFGDFAYFKKFFTTSSPLTYDFPPKTALTGMIGAMLGLSYEQRYDLFNAKFALRILKLPKKRIFGINWLNTRWRGKGIPQSTIDWLKEMGIEATKEILSFLGAEWKGQEPHTQAGIEILIDSAYRIYYLSDNPFALQLKELLSQHKTVYPLYLGNSEFIGDFNFIGEIQQVLITNPNQPIEIHSVINSTALLQETDRLAIQIHPNQKLLKISTPLLMEKERKVVGHETIYYDLSGSPITAIPIQYYQLTIADHVENIVYF